MSTQLDERAFDDVAERTLALLETALGEVEGLDVDLESGILTVEFADGVRYVVNSHRAARQIWMACGARAWHFDVDAASGTWTASKSGDELWSTLGEQLSNKLGRAVTLAPS